MSIKKSSYGLVTFMVVSYRTKGNEVEQIIGSNYFFRE